MLSRREYNTLPKVFGLIREYSELPDTNSYEPEELAIIWLYCTCIRYAFGEAMPLFEKTYEYLMNSLADKWKYVPKYIQISVKYDIIDTPSPGEVNWAYGYCAHVYRETFKYIQFMEKRFGLECEDLHGNPSGNKGLSGSRVDNKMSSVQDSA